MPAQFDVRRFPAAERLRGRGKSGRHPEVVEQTILVEAEEVLLIADHRVAVGTVEQPDVLELERYGLRLDFVGN
jgi:hypothetical protein